VILVSKYISNTISFYVSTAQFVYSESMFTASALPKFVEVMKTACCCNCSQRHCFQLASVPVTTTIALNTASQLMAR